MRRFTWEVVALGLAAVIALVCAFTPPKYVASGAVLLPGGMVRAQFTDRDPRTALSRVEEFIERQQGAVFVDRALLTRTDFRLPLAIAAAVAALAALLLFALRRERALRSERELVMVLGEPLVAARPLAVEALARQLVECWFRPGRELLAVVSSQSEDGCSHVTAQLARAFAARGEPTLLIDANLRSPRLHRAFGLRNRAGLGDFLEQRKPRLVQAGEHLSVLVAGRATEDPLELLSRKRLRELLAAASRRYRVVLIDTPAAAHGPDLQMFAALAGGALVVTRHPAPAPPLERLRRLLELSKARVVSTVLKPA